MVPTRCRDADDFLPFSRSAFPAKRRRHRLISSRQLERNPCFTAASEQAGKVIVSPSMRFDFRAFIYLFNAVKTYRFQEPQCSTSTIGLLVASCVFLDVQHIICD